MKERLLISFSGGRTSAYMTKMLLDNYQDKYDMTVVFANVGKERQQTLDFVNECDKRFGFKTIWIECQTNPIHGKGVTAKVVDYQTADLSGKVFEEMIQKYGLPNMNAPICTRNLKTYTIKAYMRQQGFRKYYNAIGIRIDEIDRVNPNHKKERIIYPLISMFPTKKTDVNQFWINQDFDLQLKSYEGNCDCCFKKSLRKLLTIAQENPQLFEWWQKMEQKYENYIPDSIKKRNHKINLPIRIFRNNLSVAEIIEMSKNFTELARDESKDIEKYKQLLFFNFELDTPNGCSESCEAF